MRISVEDAREFFEHPTQRRGAGINPDDLPGDPFEYWAAGGVCGAFHPAHWPGVWMAHYGVKPETWGKTTKPARAILLRFWDERAPRLIVGWTDSRNRAALSFARRLGFFDIGAMPLANGEVVMKGWKP